MEHIVQFGISIDDDAIKRRIEETAEAQIINKINKDVSNALFEKRYSYMDRPIDTFAKDVVNQICKDHEQEIVAMAATLLAEKLARSKAGKALFDELKE